MTFPRRLACFAFLAGGLSIAAAATPLTRLVNDRAAVILSVHDVPAVVSQWDKSPWAKTWNDEQVKKYFAPLRAQMKVEQWDEETKKATGYTVNELLAFATGDAILVVPDFEFIRSEKHDVVPPLLIGIDVGSNGGKIEELFAKAAKEKNTPDETEQFSGATVHTIQPKSEEGKPAQSPTSWAIVEGKWLLSPSKETVFAAIDAVKNGGVDNPWESSERCVRLRQRTGDSHFTFVVNVEAIYPAIRDTVIAKTKADPQQQQGPFAFDGQALLTALGLDAWRELYVTGELGDTATEVRAGLTYSESRGLLKLMAYHDGPPAQPKFVSANWATVSTAKFSLKEAYAALEEILENFNPAISGMLQGQIRKMNKDLNVDLKRDLIGSTGDTVVMVSIVPTGDAAGAASGPVNLQQLFAVSLENPEAFANAIDAFRRSMGPQGDSAFKTREYLGEKIVTYAAPNTNGAGGVSYSIAKGYFLFCVGSAAPLETALQGLTGKQPSLWEKPEVKEAWAQMPSNASAFQYQDVRALLANVFQSISQASSMMGHSAPQPVAEEGAEGEEAPKPVQPASSIPVDPSAQPDAAALAKYWSMGWGYSVRESTGIHSVYRINYPQ